MHGLELQDLKYFAPHTHPFLAKQHWAAVGYSNGETNYVHQGKQENDSEQTEAKVASSLRKRVWNPASSRVYDPSKLSSALIFLAEAFMGKVSSLRAKQKNPNCEQTRLSNRPHAVGTLVPQKRTLDMWGR